MIEAWRVAIENIMENAFRYAKSYIKIEVREDWLCISNDGPKMPEDRIQSLFRPYEKGEGGRFGLGLSIVSKVCKANHYIVKDENNKDNIRPDKVTVKLANGTTAVSTKEINNDSWKHVFENIIVFNGSDKVSYTVTQDAVSEYTTEIKASDDGNTIEIINTHVPVAPPKEEPKQEETVTPAAPAPVVEIKTEPTTTVIETPNKQTGISFMDGLFG